MAQARARISELETELQELRDAQSLRNGALEAILRDTRANLERAREEARRWQTETDNAILEGHARAQFFINAAELAEEQLRAEKEKNRQAVDTLLGLLSQKRPREDAELERWTACLVSEEFPDQAAFTADELVHVDEINHATMAEARERCEEARQETDTLREGIREVLSYFLVN
jgi:hypothetical protein